MLLAGRAFRRAGRRAPRAASARRQSRQPCLVHAEPRHPQRDLLSARRLGLHARPRADRHRRPIVFSEEKRDAQSDTSQLAPGVPAFRLRNTALDGRYRIEKEIADRSLARCRAAARPVRAAAGHAGRLSPVRAAGARTSPTAAAATPRGSATTRATPMLFAERDRLRAGAGLLGALARALGRLRRLFRRLAGAASRQAADADLHSAPKTATSR